MAYVGTPTRLADPVRTLASVLQGEASSVAGQTAVANVLMNRAEANYGRYGGDVLSQALGRNQFQGQATPTAQSLSIAQQLYDGTLPRTLTNSLNYAAPVYSGPGATTARWAINALNSGQGVNIGGNVFFQNDRGGTPTYTPNAGAANGNAPTGSGGSISAPGTAGGISVDRTGGGNYYYNPQTGAITPTTDSNPPGTSEGFGLIDSEKGILYGSGTGPGVGQSGTGSVAGTFDSTGGFTTANVAGGAGNGSFGLGGVQSGGQTVGGQDPIVGYNAAGPVMANPTLVGATNAVAEATKTGNKSIADATKEGDKQITDGVKTAGQTIGQAITSQSQSWLDWAKESFVRLAFIVTGLVLFAAALYYFAKPQIDDAVAGAVKTAGKVAKVVPIP